MLQEDLPKMRVIVKQHTLAHRVNQCRENVAALRGGRDPLTTEKVIVECVFGLGDNIFVRMGIGWTEANEAKFPKKEVARARELWGGGATKKEWETFHQRGLERFVEFLTHKIKTDKKRCPSCKELLSTDCFAGNASAWDDLQRHCKTCQSKRQKADRRKKRASTANLDLAVHDQEPEQEAVVSIACASPIAIEPEQTNVKVSKNQNGAPPALVEPAAASPAVMKLINELEDNPQDEPEDELVVPGGNVEKGSAKDNGLTPEPLGTQQCNGCGNVLPLGRFTVDPLAKNGILKTCRACIEKRKALSWLRKLGLTEDTSIQCCFCEEPKNILLFNVRRLSEDPQAISEGRACCKGCVRKKVSRDNAVISSRRADEKWKRIFEIGKMQCTKCDDVLPLSKFVKEAGGRLRGFCKDCDNKAQRERYARRKAAQNG